MGAGHRLLLEGELDAGVREQRTANGGGEIREKFGEHPFLWVSKYEKSLYTLGSSS